MAKGKILKEAQKEINIRKSNAEHIANVYMQKALSCEEYKTLYNQKMSAQIENAKQEAYGDTPQIDITEIDEKLDEVLKKLNIKKELLTPTYSCKKCNDTGYVNSKMCSCLKEEINKKHFNKPSNLSKNQNNILQIAKNKHGCCTIQKILEFDKIHTTNLIQAILL